MPARPTTRLTAASNVTADTSNRVRSDQRAGPRTWGATSEDVPMPTGQSAGFNT